MSQPHQYGFGLVAAMMGGKQKGSIPSLQEVLEAVPSTPLMFNFKSKTPQRRTSLPASLPRRGATR